MIIYVRGRFCANHLLGEVMSSRVLRACLASSMQLSRC